MVVVRVTVQGGPVVIVGFLSIPRIGEHVRLPGAPRNFTVQGVLHHAGDPADGQPPALAEILVG